MIKINLMPPEEKKDTGKKISVQLPTNVTNILLAIPVIITLAVIGFVYMKMENRIAELEETKTRYEQEHRDLQKKIQIVNELQAKQEQLKSRLATIRQLNSNRGFWENVIVDLTNKLPEEFIAFTSFTDQSDEETKRLFLEGQALSDQLVSDYIQQLRQSEFVTDVVLNQTRSTKVMGRDAREFSMVIMLKAPAADTTQVAPEEAG